MTKESIYENLENIKSDWMKSRRKKSKKGVEEGREFARKNIKYLTKLKNQYPKEFKRFYWSIYVQVKQYDIVEDTKYTKMLPYVSLCASTMGIAFSIADFFQDSLILKVGTGVSILIGCFIMIVMFGSYVCSAMNTREVSYYKIMLDILEDLRNGQEKTFSEEKYSRYVVTLQSCDSQEEDRPANSYEVIVQQRKKDR